MKGILKFHPPSDKYFGSDLSSDELKVLANRFVKGHVGPLTTVDYQIGCHWCKAQPW